MKIDAAYSLRVCLALFILLWPFSNAKSDSLVLTPYFNAKGEYNDNIFLGGNNDIKDSILTLSPGLKIENENERHTIRLSARYDDIEYQDQKDLNTSEKYASGSLSYSIDPKTAMALNADYANDARPDRDIETTGFSLSNIRREKQQYRASVQRQFDEIKGGDLDYAYESSHFEDDKSADYQFHNVDLGFNYNLSRYILSTTGSVNLGWAKYLFDMYAMDYYAATAGLTKRFSEKTSLYTQMGVRSTYTKFDFWPETFHEQGMLAKMTFNYSGLYTQTALSFSHDIKAASGLSQATRRTSFSINFNHRIYRDVFYRLYLDYFLNKADGQISLQNIDQETFQIRPYLEYRFNKKITIVGSYLYTQIDDKVANKDYHRNVGFIQIKMEYPFRF